MVLAAQQDGFPVLRAPSHAEADDVGCLERGIRSSPARGLDAVLRGYAVPRAGVGSLARLSDLLTPFYAPLSLALMVDGLALTAPLRAGFGLVLVVVDVDSRGPDEAAAWVLAGLGTLHSSFSLSKRARRVKAGHGHGCAS